MKLQIRIRALCRISAPRIVCNAIHQKMAIIIRHELWVKSNDGMGGRDDFPVPAVR